MPNGQMTGRDILCAPITPERCIISKHHHETEDLKVLEKKPRKWSIEHEFIGGRYEPIIKYNKKPIKCVIWHVDPIWFVFDGKMAIFVGIFEVFILKWLCHSVIQMIVMILFIFSLHLRGIWSRLQIVGKLVVDHRNIALIWQNVRRKIQTEELKINELTIFNIFLVWLLQLWWKIRPDCYILMY